MRRLQIRCAVGVTLLAVCAAAANAQISITVPPLPNGEINTSYPGATFTASDTDSLATCCTWTLNGSWPGLSLDTNLGTLSGTPTASGTFNFTVTATDTDANTSTTSPLSITIVAAPTISPGSLPVQDAGGYNQTLTGSGGTPPYSWSFTGNLPTGTSLNSSTGAISGSAAAGLYMFTVTVTDSVGGTGSQAYTVQINPLPTVSTNSLPAGEAGVAYPSTALMVAGGTSPYAWTITSNNLPAGMTFIGGTLAGTPSAAANVTLTFQVTDADSQIAIANLLLTINAAPVVTPASLPNGEVGVAYTTQMLSASGGSSASYTWSISGGALPGGLSLNPTNGQISGTPTTATGSPFNFTAKATDSAGGSGTQSFTITVTAGPNISPTSLPAGDAGAAYNETLSASGGASPYTWSVSSGSAGALSLNSTTGIISGTPTAGTYNFTVKVTDTAGGFATQAYSLTINAAMNITTTTLPAGDNGKAYSQTLALTGGTSPYTWSLASGSLAPLSLSSAGVISGTPTTGTLHFTVQVTDSASTPTTATSAALTITINGTLSITTTSLSAGDQGASYSQTLTATGGTTPYTWSINAGTPLPTGLMLNSSTGVISGTPTVQGSPNITVTVTDSIGATAQQTFNLTIHAPLSITTQPTLANGAVGVLYSQALSATGGATPYAWQVISGSLGQLSLNGSTGVISGTPNGAATLTFTVQLTDAILVTTTKQFSITIVSGLTITNPPTLPGGEVNALYSQTLTAAGGTPPYSWLVTLGALPNGVTLNPSSGLLSGTPSASGLFNFTVKVTDNASVTATESFSLTINSQLTITTAPALPGGSVGSNYSQTIGVSGGVSSYHFSISAGALPAGLNLDPSSGIISGTPSSSGTFSFTVQVIDSASVTASKAFTLTLVQGLNITTAPTLPAGSVNISYTAPLNVSGGTAPYSWLISTGALPGGLSLNPSTGAIAGTPTAGGTFNFTVQVTDSTSLKATKQFVLTIGSGLTITTPSPLPGGSLGVPYSVTLLATGGVPPLRWSVSSGTLPPGVILASTGALGGTPTSAGTFTFSIKVSDSTSLVASQQFSVTISSGLAISTPQLANGSVNTGYLQTLTAAGGTAPFTWRVTVGALPSALSLISSTGVISGTPLVNGTFTFTVTVTDLAGATATKQFSLSIASGLIINSSTLPAGVLTQQYSALAGAAVGGSQPYTWQISAGALPAGLILNTATGAITGTPTSAGVFNFTVRVTDTNGATATQALTISVSPPNLPQVTVAGLPETSTAAQQIGFTVALASAYPLQITGTITISFAPDAVAEADDPAIQFSTGGRTTSFSIPANTTNAVFSTPQVTLQTGSVAGTITLTFALAAGGANLPAIPDSTIAIARSAPAITNVAVVTSANGFQIQVTGYSTPRELTEADVKFTAAAGANLTTTSLTESLTTVGSQWFQSASSAQYGSQFVLVLPFTASQGNVDAVASVSVTLKNSTGASPGASANF